MLMRCNKIARFNCSQLPHEATTSAQTGRA
jgi:hypothetical protein